MILDEIVSEAEYADIIITLLRPPYKISSITKLVFMSFCIKNENDFSKYKNRKKDFIDVFISNISIKLSAHSNEISQIVRILDMLCKSNKVIIDRDYIILDHEFNFQTEIAFIKFCNNKKPNPIKEIDKLDPKALVEEVLRYV